MIELKNVCKEYKSKNAKNTQALKDVSIKFQEKGMVFVLGKSGSGKSTLLNIIGGLDKYDSGDVIINGKSTQKFKEKEFDAFRNTYMGFVFQEFNLLENYSIEQNIKLSLELQHKKATSEEIKKALEMVKLSDISKRNTNELSGGQKQRVAIARALIKNPEIILADEPTGNLDTQTSEQIWNILKKLSETKLVIVVSHDEESAEKYADRIIKIQDGEIVSDNGTNDSVINKEFKLQSARLPFFYSFKMGIGSLLHKKIRLLLSSILIVFSLICFGIMLSAYTSDMNTKVLELVEQNGGTEVAISKYKNPINYIEMINDDMNEQNNLDKAMDKYKNIELDETFKKEVEENTGIYNWQSVYSIDSENGELSMVYPSSLQSEESYPLYYYVISSPLVFVETDNVAINNLLGKKPQKDDEIVISSYLADNIIFKGCMAKDKNDDKIESEKYIPKSYNELITSGKYINFCNIGYVKIVGIVDHTEKLQKYSELKEIKASDWIFEPNEEKNKIYTGFLNYIDYNETKVYVNSSFINKLKNIKHTYSSIITKVNYDNKSYNAQMIAYIENSIDICNTDGIKTIKKLKDNEIVINESMLNEITNYDYENVYYNNRKKYDSKEEFLKQYLKDSGVINKKIKTNVNNNKLVSAESEYANYTIVGVIIDESTENYTNRTYYSKNVIESLIRSNIHFYSVTNKINNIQEMSRVLKYYPIDNSDTLSKSNYSDKVLQSAAISYMLQFVSKYGIVFFLIFSTIILMSFINSSIGFRKKEIGILRALGCRSNDIVKMFLYESLVLMIVALIISFAIIPNLVSFVNKFISEELLIEISVLSFGLKQMIQITGIMFVIVFLGNILPVRKITKMKPIDAILNK